MSRLSDLRQKLADQQAAARELAAQAEHAKGEESHRLLRKRERTMLAVQATQNNIDEVLHRVAYLRVAYSQAQENLAALERHMKATGGPEDGRTTAQREIDGILREIAKLEAPETLT
jgi:hypothetical protein